MKILIARFRLSLHCFVQNLKEFPNAYHRQDQEVQEMTFMDGTEPRTVTTYIGCSCGKTFYGKISDYFKKL